MIETEIKTINEFGSRRLTIRFPSAGVPTNVPTILGVPQVYSVRKDDQGYVTSFTVDLGTEGDYWPVEQTLRMIKDWKYKISDEDITAIREQFPYQWKPTWDSLADSPLPPGWTCNDCDHEATVCFRTWPQDIHDALQYDKMLCRHCAFLRQKEYAENKIAELEESLEEINLKLREVSCGEINMEP